MQRSKLKVGTEYLWSDSSRWREYSFHVPKRVRLIAINVPGRPSVVRVLDVDHGHEFHATPLSLRGEWSAACAERTETLARLKADADAKRAARGLARRSAEAMVERCAHIGLTVDPQAAHDKGGDLVFKYQITADDLAAFLTKMGA